MPWTWDVLRPALEKLELPDGQYVVGLSGALLANESLEIVDEVELLVTDDLYGELEQRGWLWDRGHGGLLCPSEDDHGGGRGPCPLPGVDVGAGAGHADRPRPPRR